MAARAYIPRDAFIIGEYPSLADEIAAFLVEGGAKRTEKGTGTGEVLPTISEAESESETDDLGIRLSSESLPAPAPTPRQNRQHSDMRSVNENRARCSFMPLDCTEVRLCNASKFVGFLTSTSALQAPSHTGYTTGRQHPCRACIWHPSPWVRLSSAIAPWTRSSTLLRMIRSQRRSR